MKKTISLLLAVVMMLSLSVTAFAQAVYTGPTYNTYTALGDSIPAGYGLDSYDTHAQTVGGKVAGGVYDNCRDVIADSYPALVGDAVGARTIPLAHCGFRSTEIRALVDDSYNGDEYTSYVCANLSDISVDEFNGLKATFSQGIKGADLITLNVGSNDTMTYALIRMNAYLAEKSTDSSTDAALEEAMSHLGTLGVALDKMLTTAESMGQTTGAINELTAAMMEGFINFQTNFSKIVENIYSMNSDVKLVVVGMYNPFRDVKLTDASLLQIGKLADQFVGLMNNYMKVLCTYSSKYTYVEAPDTEVYEFPALTSDEFMSNFVKNVHPTVAGHAYMAQQILNALGSKNTSVIGSILDKFQDTIDKNKDTINDALGGLLGDGSDADLADEDTPLAASVALNTTDHNAYINGYTDGSFRPVNGITRAEAAQMLYNLLTADSHAKNDTTTNTFSDVSASQWFNTAVSTLANAGAISGYADGTFRPNATITRAEFVKMVVGLVGETSGAKSTFSDVASGTWYYASVASAQTSGWVEGSGGTFRPNASMTRAETVTFLNRVLGRTCDASYVTSHSVKSFTDVANGAWYFAAVMEAANGHNYTKTTSGAEAWISLK